MKAATDLARRILSKEEAIRKTKSQMLKNDLMKSVRNDKNELLFYCRSRGFTIDEVFKEAKNPCKLAQIRVKWTGKEVKA